MTACVDRYAQTRPPELFFDKRLFPTALATLAQKMHTVASEEFFEERMPTFGERPSHPTAYALDNLSNVLDELKRDAISINPTDESEKMQSIRDIDCVLESLLRDLSRVAFEAEKSVAQFKKPVLDFCEIKISKIRQSLSYFATKTILDIYTITKSESPDTKDFTASTTTLSKIFNVSNSFLDLEKKVKGDSA